MAIPCLQTGGGLVTLCFHLEPKAEFDRSGLQVNLNLQPLLEMFLWRMGSSPIDSRSGSTTHLNWVLLLGTEG